MIRRAFACAGVALLLFHGLVHARQAVTPETPRPGIDAVRLHVGVVPLFGFAGPQGAMDTTVSASGRAVIGLQLNQRLNVYAGGLRASPPGLAMTAGLAGARYTTGRGNLRMGGFVEAGFGELRAYRPTTSMAYVDAGGVTRDIQLPAYRSANVPGGGAGIEADYEVARGILLRATAGYWRFTEGGFGVRHSFGGLGLAWAHRDEAWYWWRSGRDRTPPVLAVMNPSSDTLNAYDPDTEPLVVVASALSGIATLEVNGRPVAFRRISARETEAPVRGAAVIVSIPLGIEPGGSDRIRITAADRSGNRVERDILVLGPAPDREPPVIALPSVISVPTHKASIQGYVLDRSPVARITVGGVDAVATPVGRNQVPDEIDVGRGFRVVRFTAHLELETPVHRVIVVAVDSLGHRAEMQVEVVLQSIAEPHVEVFHPDSASEVTSDQVTVMGAVMHWAPLRMIIIGAEEVRTREVDATDVIPGRATAGMRAWLFEATVSLNFGRNRITVLARDMEGRQGVTAIEVTRSLPPDIQP